MKPELPEVRQAILDQSDVDALFRDISLLVELHDVRRRGQTDGDEEEMTLPEAREVLRSSAAEAVQLRYRHDGHEWIDTLVLGESGVQLTRIAIVAEDGEA